MTPQRSQRIEERLADLGIVYDAAADVFASYDGLVDRESILAAMPDLLVNDLAAFVERQRMMRSRTPTRVVLRRADSTLLPQRPAA